MAPLTQSQQTGDWHEYQRLVLHSLQQLETGLAGLGTEMQKLAVTVTAQDLREEVAQLQKKTGHHSEEIIALKVKAGVWGLMGGLIPVLLALLLQLLK